MKPTNFHIATSIAILIGLSFICFAQDQQANPQGQDLNPYNSVTGGISIRPIFPSKIFGNGTLTFDSGDASKVNFQVQHKVSYSAGAIIRRSFTKLLSIETGLFYTRRAYTMKVLDPLLNNSPIDIDYRTVSFGIPMQALVSVQLSKKIFSTVGLGLSADFYPSNIFVKGGTTYNVGGLRSSFIGGSLIVNLGFEYRTKKDGIIYLGGMYNRPFANYMYNEITYFQSNGNVIQNGTDLAGSYFAIDFRYYLQPSLIKKKEKKKSKKGKKEFTY
jgi:hypothetical protein